MKIKNKKNPRKEMKNKIKNENKIWNKNDQKKFQKEYNVWGKTITSKIEEVWQKKEMIKIKIKS